MKKNLFESYMKQASRYLKEEDEFDVVDEPIEDGAEEGAEEGDEEEEFDLDLANPVCPSCGAKLNPIGEIDTTEEDEEGNPVFDEEEADAINLLQSMGYVVYKPEDVEDETDFEDEEF